MRHKDFWGSLAVGLGVLFFGTGGYWSATWLSKWALMAGLSAVGFSFWVAKHTSFWHLPLLLYAFGSLIALSMWPQGPYHDLVDQVTEMALQKNAFYGLVELASCVGLVALISRCRKATAQGFLGSLCVTWFAGVVATLLLPSSGPHSPPNNGMWFGNPSMEGSLFACLWPIVCGALLPRNLLKYSLLALSLWLLTFWAIARTHASVPWGVLGVVTGVMVVHPFRASFKQLFKIALPVTAGLAIAMIWFGEHYLGYEFWNQNGRFEIWGMALRYFHEHAHPAIGFGYSTTQIFLPLEQITTGYMKGQTFLWLHNDWLQLVIEGGSIGMTCVLLSLARLFQAGWASTPLTAFLAGFVTLGFMNYPLRMPIHCFALAVVCGVIEREAWGASWGAATASPPSHKTSH